MRIRNIKPEFYRSEDIKKLSREDRMLFIGVWSYVDDNGVGVDDYRQIAADLFPLEDDPLEVREFVREGLQRLARGSLLSRYMIDNKAYVFVNGWAKHQKVHNPNKPRFPLPNGEVAHPTSDYVVSTDDLPRVSVEPPESLGTGSGGQGVRGSGTYAPSPKRAPKRKRNDEYTPEFEQWWTHYPRGKDKFKALKPFKDALELVPLEVLVEGARRYAGEVRGWEQQHIKLPASWLNGHCWENYMPQQTSSSEEAAREWLRGEHAAGRVKPIQEKTGLVYLEPDLPLEVSGDQVEAFYLEAVRKWIVDNSTEILRRLTLREAG